MNQVADVEMQLKDVNGFYFILLKTNLKKIKLEDEIETNFELLGLTALEDKLQDGVPETIKEIH